MCIRDRLTPTPQSGEPTYAHKIDKFEARLDWSLSARNLESNIRGLSPFPGAWCEIDGRRVKVHLARVVNEQGLPGQVLNDALTIACGEDALQLLSVQPAGKSRMSAEDFLRGTPVLTGSRLE